jgi:predicted DNA-binding protein
MSRKKISTTIYVTPEQSDKLKLLLERTKVPVAVYIREGIDLVLKHYAHLLPGQLALESDARKLRTTTERAAAEKAERQSSARLPIAANADEDDGRSERDERVERVERVERGERATMKDGTNSAAAGGGKK